MNDVAGAECNGMIGKLNTGLEEWLQIRNKRITKTLEDESGNAITACCLEGT
jgi:hypothetical protein